jgi:outer membrane protein TolC
MTLRSSQIVVIAVTLFTLPAYGQLPQPAAPSAGTQAVQLPLSGRSGQAGGVVVNQTAIPGVTTSVNTLSTNVQVQGPYSGSVTGRAADLTGGKLTLKEAIRRGLEYNLGSIGMNQALRQSRGQSRVARSGLLPSISANLRENVQQTNLAAFGFSLPGRPSVVGPFNYFDLRATLNQTVLDFTTLHNYRASKANTDAAEMSARDARDLVVFAVSGAYLQVIAAQARINSVRSQIDTAKAMFSQMQQQRSVGVVAQIDVNRSQVELQTQQQRLVSLQNDLAKQKINLARIIGLPPAANIDVADDIPFAPAPELTVDQALQQARENRSDLKAAEAQVHAAELARSAARAERLPSLAFSADYGAIGANPSNSHGTFTVVGSLRVPIWQGGRTEGSIMQAEAALGQRRAELEDLRGRIEADLRSAFLDLGSAQSQIEVARNNQELARETLRLTRERFDAGITTTVEVVQAQQSVSAADLDYITSVFAHNVAKISLARAVGKAEENVARFLQVQ